MNVCILIGRLTKDPELRYTQSGTAVASFSMAVDRQFTGKDGQKQVDFFNVVAWGKQGENVANYLTKGKQVAVKGSIQNRSYETQSGEKRYITEIVAENVQFLGSKGDGGGGNQAGGFEPEYRELEDDDTPF
ncbi:MAG: single-stranded DNA-binding protein [Peptostreptococcaceae bacterium]|nr:single-stranded DNA-binding protein [Peptostreptococcaceae bacterium]